MSPEPAPALIFDLGRDDPGQAAEAAARALEQGGLVILPTETVYGLAAREDRPDAGARLRAVKSERTEPFTRAVASLETLESRLAPLSRVAHRAADRWWPGPVTLVLPASSGGSLGVRIPGHDWTRDLLARVGVPLLLPSANEPGEPAPLHPADIAPAIREQTAVLVSDGATALGDSSTVLRPGGVISLLLREGTVNRDDLLREVVPRILVLCSGNTCRSPMAVAMLTAAFDAAVAEDPRILAPRVTSAGAFTSGGHGASDHAIDVMAARGLDIADHASRPVTAEELRSMDLVLCMTRSHQDSVRALLPEGADSLPDVELFDLQGEDVQDPFSGPRGIYEACAAHLAAMAGARVAAWMPEEGDSR